MNGIRSAATIGGTIAFRTAIRSDATTAPPKPWTATPGTRYAATSSDAAATSHESRSLNGRTRGRSGFQTGLSPCGAGPDIASRTLTSDRGRA